MTLVGLPNKVDDRRQEDHQGHDRPGLPHQDRQGLARRQPRQPVLPGGGDPERRADRAQHRHRGPADRRAPAAQAGRPPPPPPRPAAAAARPRPAAKPLSRLEKLRLENKQKTRARPNEVETAKRTASTGSMIGHPRLSQAQRSDSRRRSSPACVQDKDLFAMQQVDLRRSAVCRPPSARPSAATLRGHARPDGRVPRQAGGPLRPPGGSRSSRPRST